MFSTKMMFSTKALLQFTLTSILISSTAAQTFAIGAPAAGSTVHRGQSVTVRIQVPIDTSPEAGELDLALAIGLLSCPTTTCAAPSADLGETLFTGVYQGQGALPNTLISFENFTLTVPSDFPVGNASFHALRTFLLTLPGGHSFPANESAGLDVMVAA
ncbi:hypothetical protein C8J56DRAFT_1081841 [Mycena floridula]|nr:hypothetical protein C8J56DRAFT_1081841 [Mycena floridula]